MKLLNEKEFSRLLVPLEEVTINNLFARFVIEQKVKGKIFVDNLDNPQTYYVVHPYGMTLLFGESDNTEFNREFREYALNTNHIRDGYEWMQTFPRRWDTVLNTLFEDSLVLSAENTMQQQKGIIELNTRVNFKFDHDAYNNLRYANLPNDVTIIKTDKDIFRDMKGSVIPLHFWANESDFLEHGVGFSLFYKDRLASTAFASFIHEDKLELGIETVAEFRGKGLAEIVCSALIDYCIANNYEPIWACRLENVGSYKLAQKIGFIPAIEIPYYQLSN